MVGGVLLSVHALLFLDVRYIFCHIRQNITA
jgi:hypothetical protein